MKKQNIKLYNVIFPLWALMIFPQAWLIAAPANFVIDFAVVYFMMKKLGIDAPKDKTKKVILKVWLRGFAGDFAGGIFMFASSFFSSNRWWYQNIARHVYNPFRNIYVFLWTGACVLLSAVAIYCLNKIYCFNQSDFEEMHIKKISLALAIITAPYLFLLPTVWFY